MARDAASKNDTDDLSAVVQQIRWTGVARGLVKNLSGFQKKHHTVPDAATPAAVSFLGRLCAGELAAETEAFFQKTRTALNYKRRDLNLSCGGGAALLQTRDFSLEWLYVLDETTPADWVLTRTLHGVRSRDLLDTPEFDALLSDTFSTLEFLLTKPVRIEDVIDTVEAMEDDDTALGVDYPSDCAHCTLRVPGVAAAVVFNGTALRMEFPVAGSPRELVTAFCRVRGAFSLVKSTPLAGLL